MRKLRNPTAWPMVARHCGVVYRIGPGETITVKSGTIRRQTVTDEEIAVKLMSDCGRVGLVLLAEDGTDKPKEEQTEESLDLMCKFLEEQLEYFNNMNQEQAARGLKIIMPPKFIRKMQKLLEKYEGHETRIVSRDELDRITDREEANTFETLHRVAAAAATGDMDAVRAALPRDVKEKKEAKDPRRNIVIPDTTKRKKGLGAGVSPGGRPKE